MTATEAKYGRENNNGSREDQDINGSKEDQDDNGSSEDQDINGSNKDHDNNGSNKDYDNNGSSEDQDNNGSNEDQDNNGSSEDQNNNGSNEDQDINGSSETQDINAPLDENNLIRHFYQNAFFTNKILFTIIQNQREIINNLRFVSEIIGVRGGVTCGGAGSMGEESLGFEGLNVSTGRRMGNGSKNSGWD